MKKTVTYAILAAAMALPFHAFADASDIRALASAKISLVDAIQAAEKETGGKAYDANIDDDAAAAEYEVGIIKDGKVYEVRINGVDGKVLSSREDLDD